MTWTSRGLSALLLAIALLPRHAVAEHIAFYPIKDNTLFDDAAGALSSGSGPGLFAGKNGTLITRRALIAFDVASRIPAGSRIDAVGLVLHVASAPNDTLRLMTLHRVLADWGEGASSSNGGTGAPSATGDATWLHTFYDDRFWATPGGDFVATESASGVVGPSGFHTWFGTDMTRDVQLWIDSPSMNFGWMIRGPESAVRSVRRFDSRESDSTAFRPQLIVEYTPGNIKTLRVASSRPNPFTNETQIDFEVPGSRRARIDVFDARGRYVTTLVDRVASGFASARWDGRNRNGQLVRAGVYFLRLSAAGLDDVSRRVILLR